MLDRVDIVYFVKHKSDEASTDQDDSSDETPEETESSD